MNWIRGATGSWCVFLALALLARGTAVCGEVDYLKDIKPVLKSRCYACHGALKQKSGLRLDTVAAMRKGGQGGSILTPGKAALLERITNSDEQERMPPEGAPLSAEEIGRIKEWLIAGAKGLSDEQPQPDPRQHWAYQPPRRSPGNIDTLLAARLKDKGLLLQTEAAPEVWLRRVYFDLIGIPPSAENVRAFQKAADDDAASARTQTVDALLNSPQYGERWARHFMDIWRYCDWYGLDDQLRHSQKHIWHWRDWIVESLNAGKGYDRMIVEMLAADEETPADREALRATGFLCRSYYLFNRTTWLDDVIEHTSRAFLGVTMQCVKCHDHKYDPIEQADYYHMRAIFEPYHVRLDAWPGEPDFEKNGLPRTFDLHLDRATYRHVRGDEKNEDKSRVMAPGVPAVLSFAEFKPAAVESRTALPQFVLDDQLAVAEHGIALAKEALDKARKTFAEIQHATPKTNASAAKIETAAPRIVAQDDFKSSKPEQWQILKGDWRHANGAMRQHDKAQERHALQLRAAAPADFSASLSFTIRGGEKYKSTGLSFDVADDNHVLIYMSAYDKGPKLQVAVTKNGKSSYPIDGMVARTVVPNTRYEMDIQVRGQLINVSIDGKPALAYALPDARRTGSMQIVAFDADVEFSAFTLSELPVDVSLRQAGEVKSAGGAKVVTLSEAEADAALAGKALALAESKPAMLRAAFAADQARMQHPPEQKDSEHLSALIANAAKAGAEYQLAQAELELAKLRRTPPPKKEDAEKKLKDAAQAVEAAKKKAAAPEKSYASIRATLKAQDGPEEKTNADVQQYPATSTGRRLAFARWIADRRNPLTARVLVNHVWMRHFGAPLVPDVSDFGLRSRPPLQKDVLDTLAVDFMEQGWNLKGLHKQMVLSRHYRTSSSNLNADAATLAADPENAYCWRMNARRLESQAIRDALLSIAGSLDLRQGGPSIDPKEESSPRRALYFVQNANVEHRFLGAFDNASVLECYRRQDSIVPQQALALANSKLTRECAEAVAERLAKLEEPAFVDEAFLTLLGRPPNREEARACAESLQALSGLQSGKPDSRRARALFLQALISHNDFITLR